MTDLNVINVGQNIFVAEIVSIILFYQLKIILNPDPIFCIINKKLIECALGLYFCIGKNHDTEKLQRYIKAKKRFSF